MSALEIILSAMNIGTLILLGMSIRSTKRWIAAYRDAVHSFRRYASKRETVKIRNENGGW